MRYREIETNELDLLEAQLTPGQVKAIKLKISDYQKQLRELENKRYELDRQFVDTDLPEELKDKIDAYVNAYTNAIEKLKDQLKQENSDTDLERFLAGVEKNCSEIISVYKNAGRVLYSGFKNAENQTAIYGKPPARPSVPESYKQRYFDELSELVEQHDLANFDNTVMATTDGYDAATDGRTAYMIFPRNGFKFFYSKGLEQFYTGETRVPRLFDWDEVKRGWKYFIENPEMFEKFRAAGGVVYETSSKYLGTDDGFMGRYAWKNNIAAIDKMHEKGEIDDDWGYYTNWTTWVSRESLQKSLEIAHTDLSYVMRNGNDVFIQASGIYGINAKYYNKILRALGI